MSATEDLRRSETFSPKVPSGYSPRLYNPDIAPRGDHAPWTAWGLFAWWMSAWHSLGNYTAAVGLLVLGLMGWQLAVGLCLGVLVLYVMSNVMGIAGQKVGVPFPVFARASFGVFGANIPAILRAIVAVAWYGIQTYLASVALLILVLKVYPNAQPLTEVSLFGLSGLGWICFLALWVAQLFVLHRGMETVRKLTEFAGPTIWIAMFALAVWTLDRADWSIDWTYSVGSPLGFGAAVGAILTAAFLIVSNLSGPLVNFADFTRLSPDRATVVKGNRLGLLINGIAFCVVSIVITLASVKVYGQAVNDPIEMVRDVDNVTVLLLTILVVAVATAGANVVLNFVSPAYDFVNVAPHRISFRTGGVITAVLSVVIMPWNLYSSPIVVNLFLGGIGALMGPVAGILATDFYLVRRAQIDQDSLYTDAPDGRYYYSRGTNVNSVIALGLSGTIALSLALVPALGDFHAFAWPVGLVLGGVFCLVVNRLRPNVHARAASLGEPMTHE